MRRLKVLVFSEAVTLAHVARPVALARQLDRQSFDIVFAVASRYANFAQSEDWRQVELETIGFEDFRRSLERGMPVYTAATLERYIEADRGLIARHRPDVILGDFRLSLSVSARVAGVPYISIVNAYWCPAFDVHFMMPVLAGLSRVPLSLAEAIFCCVRPLAFALHARPINEVRRRYGLPALGSDLRRVYSDADHLLIPDLPSLFPLKASAHGLSMIAPLLWSPEVDLPSSLDLQCGDDFPVVYVTMGSSGPSRVLEEVLNALASLPIRVVGSTAGMLVPPICPSNARLAPYLPGGEITKRAALVICNGGSLTVQQAFAHGVPVLGIASNMDQFLNMASVVESGAGLLLRSDRLSGLELRRACEMLLSVPTYRAAARRLKAEFEVLPTAGGEFGSVSKALIGLGKLAGLG